MAKNDILGTTSVVILLHSLIERKKQVHFTGFAVGCQMRCKGVQNCLTMSSNFPPFSFTGGEILRMNAFPINSKKVEIWRPDTDHLHSSWPVADSRLMSRMAAVGTGKSVRKYYLCQTKNAKLSSLYELKYRPNIKSWYRFSRFIYIEFLLH